MAKKKDNSTSTDTKRASGQRKALLKSSALTPQKGPTKRAVDIKTVNAEIIETDDSDVAPEAFVQELEADAGFDIDHPRDEIVTPTLDTSAEILNADDDDSDSKLAKTPAVAAVDPVALYMAELRKYPLLTREQEHELAVRYKETGDAKAAEALVTSNLRFVVKIAAEYTKFGAKLIDLIQEGNVGLMHGVKEFNPYKGVRLITYAVWWIRGYIQEYLMRQYSVVRIGTTQNQRKLFYRLQKEKEALGALGLEPTAKLLSAKLGVTEEEVETMQKRLKGRDVSLNAPLDLDSKSTLIDLETDDSPAVDEQLGHEQELHHLKEKIEAIRPGLNEKEIFILENRLLADEPMTLQEIGDKYGTTREAVRQVENRLMSKIKMAYQQSD